MMKSAFIISRHLFIGIAIRNMMTSGNVLNTVISYSLLNFVGNVDLSAIAWKMADNVAAITDSTAAMEISNQQAWTVSCAKLLKTWKQCIYVAPLSFGVNLL